MQVKLKKSLIAGGVFYRAGSILDLTATPEFARTKVYCEKLGELAGSGPKKFSEGEQGQVVRGAVVPRKRPSVPTPPAAFLQERAEDSFKEESADEKSPAPRKPRRG